MPSHVLEADDKATRAIAVFGADDERSLAARYIAIYDRAECRAFDSALSLADQLIADCTRVLGRFYELTDKVIGRKWFSLNESGDKRRALEFAEENRQAWHAAKGADDLNTLRWQFHHCMSTVENDVARQRLEVVVLAARKALGQKHELTRTNKQRRLSSSIFVYFAN